MSGFLKSTKSRVLIVSALAITLAAGIAGMLFAGKENAGKDKNGGVTEEANQEVSFDHIHGLGYSGDGESLLVPAHDGIRIFEKGSWKKSEEEPHDYMGFSATKEGFYSSGHPAPGSSLKNPLGVVKGDTFGSEIQPLALHGEVDFHGMAAGYNSNAIYVINPAPNSLMEDTGLYFTVDEAKTWSASSAANLPEQASSIAVHPNSESSVAIGTGQGAFISSDHGSSFKQVLSGEPVSAVAYTFTEKLLIGSLDTKAKLTLTDLNGGESVNLKIPSASEGEFITFIAANPKKQNVIVYSTSENNIYLSTDAGENWSAIAEEGKSAQLK